MSPRISGGILAHGDGIADPVATVRALAVAVEELELNFEAKAVEHDGGRVTGVRGVDRTIACEQVVIAAGPWSPALAPGGAGPPCARPGADRGAAVRGGAAPLGRIVRTPRCYLVPRTDGRVVVGATVEEQGFDTAVTADGVFRLLEGAWEVLPEVGELELLGARAGLPPRHARQHGAGRAGRVEGLVWATGHWRNGVLLAPYTGEAVAAILTGGEPPAGLAPDRFERALPA